MARRRLAPLPDGFAAELAADTDVPRAEHSAPAFPPAGPIARVAAEAAGAAALEEMAETLRRAREDGRMVLDLPLDAIAPDHLARDRLPRRGRGDGGAAREPPRPRPAHARSR